MRRRLVAPLFCLAVLGALPVAASASPVLTENGVAVPVGATVQATSIGIPVVEASPFNYECIRSVMHGNVARNSGTRVEIEFSSFSLTDCTNALGSMTVEAKNLPWCWRTAEAADSFELRAGKCSEAAKALTIVANSCAYTRTAVTGTFKTSPEFFWMMFVEREFAPELGFNCQKIKLDFNYKVETAGSVENSLFIA